MKLKSIYLVSMALLAGVFAACNDNDVENFDNQVYINGSAMTSTVLLKKHCFRYGRFIPDFNGSS